VSAFREGLDRDQHLTLPSHGFEPWFRRITLALLLGVVAAGLANVFGQDSSVTRVEGPAATLEVDAPAVARGGLQYQAKFTVTARRELEKPMIVLDSGWFEGVTVNTVNPEPTEWTQRGGRQVLTFGPVAADDVLDLRLQYQVNPTELGRRDQDVVLEDGGVPIVSIARALTIYP
jgi:hypothetical protein